MNKENLRKLAMGVRVYPFLPHDPEDTLMVQITPRELGLIGMGQEVLRLCAMENPMLLGHLVPDIDELNNKIQELILAQKMPEGFGEGLED